ncbi:MAG: anthranilate phosphoribosyltransferase, partial [Chthoniobacterales bacterium]
YTPRLTSIFAEVLQQLGRERAWCVHGLAGEDVGMDDLSVCGRSRISELRNGAISTWEIEPADAGLSLGQLADLRGDECEDNAAIIEGLLSGEVRGTKREMTLLNAAGGFVVAGLALDLPAGVALAREQLDSGRALAKLRALQNFRA